MNKSNLLCVGYIKKVSRKKFGIYIKLNKNTFWEPKKGKTIVVGEEKYSIKEVLESKNLLLISLKGISDFKKLFGFMGLNVFAPLKDFYRESFSRDMLVGSTVKTETGEILGCVKDIIKTGANDVLEVEGTKEILLPFTQLCVKKVDVKGKEITVRSLDGWIE
ncbi:MAG: ribosome maturation factor RimM [bacterium]